MYLSYPGEKIGKCVNLITFLFVVIGTNCHVQPSNLTKSFLVCRLIQHGMNESDAYRYFVLRAQKIAISHGYDIINWQGDWSYQFFFAYLNFPASFNKQFLILVGKRHLTTLETSWIVKPWCITGISLHPIGWHLINTVFTSILVGKQQLACLAPLAKLNQQIYQ